ncbi:MAG: ADP-ribosylglycohydrolase family protein, partial [Clostridiales bacterium]|nr:ADP-ribosylglycohydrolase family protein [Clostridiales bacterium]
MKKAWEIARIMTDEAIPKLLSEEEQTWEASIDAGEAEDAHLKLLWNSNVPGSYAPESIMLAAVQAKENLGYIVENGVSIWEEGQKALKENDMVALNQISVRLWNAVNHAKKDETHPSWTFTHYQSWAQYEENVSFLPPTAVDKDTLEEKMHSGWLGQIVGGAIGTMLEGYTTQTIQQVFGDVRAYLRKPSTYNDDITYELAFLYAYEQKGPAITSTDVAESWIGYVPSGWSAEEMAIRNIRWGIMPPE